MMKYSFLIYHKEYIPFLEKLQDLGMLHIIEKKKDIDENIKSSLQLAKEYQKSLKFLAQRNQIEAPEKTNLSGLELMENIRKFTEEISSIEQEQNSIGKDIQRAAPWGNFPTDMYKKLEDLNLKIRFFTCSDKKFNPEWTRNHYAEIVNKTESRIYLVVFQTENNPIEIDAEEIKLPEWSLNELQSKFEHNKNRLSEINDFFNEYAIKYQDILRQAKAELQEKIDFELAINHTEKQAEDRLMLLEGWIPEEKKEALESLLEKENIYYVSSNPEREDNVPIKLKNSKFNKLFEPIGDLFSLPDYKELDLTPFFAPFFMLFFGFCVGDTGYGLFILIATLIFRRKASKALKPMLTLASWLCGATVLMGLVSGTFFGIELVNVKAYPLKDIILEPMKLFWLSIGIGGLQIFYGMFIKAANQIRQGGLKYGLSTIGYILMIISGALIVLLPNAGIELPKFVKIALLGLSGSLILVFSNPDVSIFASVGSGLYDVYNMLTGIFGDLLSYIRLFALGISSAILGLVFNQIAAQFLGGGVFSYIPFILILLIGHGLNIFLAGLGAFVHPLRLTFVEFYKNAGFNGGGKAYKPFSKQINN